MPFDGATYSRKDDQARLLGQLERVQALMDDGAWRTLNEISDGTHDPPQSVSARLRDLRKEKFGAFNVERRRRNAGLWEYRVLEPVAAMTGMLF